jgi:hypothetical protein
MKSILLFFCCFSISILCGQNRIFLFGNSKKICSESDSLIVERGLVLPSSLSGYAAIFIFSTAESLLGPQDVNRLVAYLEGGGGLYCGSDNWPLMAESRVVTLHLFNKESWGDFDKLEAEVTTTLTSNQLFRGARLFQRAQQRLLSPWIIG